MNRVLRGFTVASSGFIVFELFKQFYFQVLPVLLSFTLMGGMVRKINE